ncbi:probable cationic amino acid transporter [Photinus pyralis]|uniref:probable cationic amino acid transporter n=1 Tax=Photinus pyralis TaxID=7054 RepID=UPI001266E97F|nr:probable cationic amino acid transporter [Photinus pyralis]
MGETETPLSSHWALGSLVLIGLATSELAGASTIVALPLTALTVALGALCEPAARPKEATTRKRSFRDIVEFVEIWFNILELLAAGATSARVASATMDYMSRGRLRDWLFGLESHSLGEPWPDVLGVTIVVVTTALFMLGLDKSSTLSILLYAGLGVSFVFFIVVGSLHTDTIFWNWTEDFTLNGWSCILTTSAMCAYAFPNEILTNQKKLCLKYGCFIVVPLLCYVLIVVVFTLMSHFRELAGTAIPLVRVFEIRDVDWARPVMATSTIFVSCIALTEIIPSFCNCVLRLASKEWRMLVSSLLYRNPLTGAPVLSIFTVGSLTSILAFACPLSYLVRLLNVAPLLKCALRSSRVLYVRYKPEFVHEDLSVQHTNIQYSRLQKGQKRTVKPSPTARIKTAFDIMPRFFRSATVPCTSTGILDDNECLLMDDYSTQSTRECAHDGDSDTESDVNEILSMADADEAESSSSTDIDAVVQEYKEKVQVATVNNFGESKMPTQRTSQVVLGALVIIYISSSLTMTGIFMDMSQLIWPSVSETREEVEKGGENGGKRESDQNGSTGNPYKRRNTTTEPVVRRWWQPCC